MITGCEFKDLEGKTLTKIEGMEKGSDEVKFFCDDGTEYLMYHDQDCCESVDLDDVIGEAEDLIQSKILMAEEVTNSDENPEGVSPACQESFTWTFYKLRTMKGSVTLRWYGESNGYYSESVEFVIVKQLKE